MNLEVSLNRLTLHVRCSVSIARNFHRSAIDARASWAIVDVERHCNYCHFSLIAAAAAASFALLVRWRESSSRRLIIATQALKRNDKRQDSMSMTRWVARVALTKKQRERKTHWNETWKIGCVIDLDPSLSFFFTFFTHSIELVRSTQPIRLCHRVWLSPLHRVGVCIQLKKKECTQWSEAQSKRERGGKTRRKRRKKSIHTLQCIYNATTKLHRTSDIVCATENKKGKQKRGENTLAYTSVEWNGEREGTTRSFHTAKWRRSVYRAPFLVENEFFFCCCKQRKMCLKIDDEKSPKKTRQHKFFLPFFVHASVKTFFFASLPHFFPIEKLLVVGRRVGFSGEGVNFFRVLCTSRKFAIDIDSFLRN